MKPCYFLLCLFLSAPLWAQLPYTPFAFTGSVWREFYYDGSGGQSPLFKDYQHIISGDTLINGVSYSKLHTYGLITYSSMPPSPSYNFGGYAGAIRETANREIRIMLPGDSSETLLYDFNIGLGDTIALYHTEGIVVTVERVDTIDVCGQQRNRYLLHFNTGLLTPLYLIEGVGSSQGLIPEYEYFESGSNLLCYSNAQCAPCALVGQREAFVEPPVVRLLPNPVHTQLQIESPWCAWLAVSIFDAHGKLLESSGFPGTQLQLPVAHWEPGIYLVQVRFKDAIWTGRLVKT